MNGEITYGSLFTGIGGFDLGFDRAGMRCLWQVERDKDCNRVLDRHWPHVQRGDDVRTVSPERFGRVDVICGGFPCQDLSVAGNRKGLAGERSGLWHEFRRIVAEFTPRLVVIENVPGLYSSHGGRDLLTVIRGLEELGYGVAWACLDSQYRGVPQRRDRVFIVGSLGDGRCAEILFEPESVRGDSPPRRETGQGVAGTIGGSPQSGGFRTTDLDNNGAFIVSPSVTSKWAKGSGGPSGDECQNLVAFDTTQITSKENRCNPQTGDPCHPLASGAHAPAIAFSCKDHGADAGELAPTLRSMGHDQSHLNGGGQVAIAFQTRIARNGRGQPEEIVPALSGADCGATSDMRPCVAWSIMPQNSGKDYKARQVEVLQPLMAGGPTSGNQGGDYIQTPTMMVRRLTPRECERLQGFPDDHTRWDAAGKEISDSARYKMCGNAVTATVSELLGHQIVKSLASETHPKPFINLPIKTYFNGTPELLQL